MLAKTKKHTAQMRAASLFACILALLLSFIPLLGKAFAFADEGDTSSSSGVLTIQVPEPVDDGNGNYVTEPSESGEGTAGTTLSFKYISSYEVTFDANGGTFASGTTTSFRVIHGTTLQDGTTSPAFSAAPSVTNADGQFMGWFYEGGAHDGEAFDATLAIEATTTVKAKWTAIHTVTFATAGGTPVPAAQKVLDGNKATQPTEVPTKAGALFKGWQAEGATELFDFENTPITADMTINATWAASYTVIFDLQGGTGTFDAQQVEEGTCATRPNSIPTMAGKDFWHWYAGDDANTAYDFSTPVTGPLTLKAAWVPKTYHITYDRSMYGDDGRLNVENPVYRYQMGDPTFALDADVLKPTRENYDFVGWTIAVKPGEEGELKVDGATTGTCVYVGAGSWGTLRLTAEWRQKDDSTVDVPAPVEGPDGEMTTEPSDPETTGGTVLAVRTYDGENPPLDTLDISFETHGGTPVESIPVPAQPNTPIPDDERTMPTTTRTGYVFAGWFERWDDDLQQGVGQKIDRLPEVYPVDGAVYHASWTPITYSIEFYRDSKFEDTAGLADTTQTLLYSTNANTPVKLPSYDSTADKVLGQDGHIFGYVLTGWRTTPQDALVAHTYKANGSANAPADAPTLAELIAAVAGTNAGADILGDNTGANPDKRTIKLYAVWVPVYDVTVPVGADKSVAFQIDVTKEEVTRNVDNYYVQSNSGREVDVYGQSQVNRTVFDAIFSLDAANEASAAYTDAADAVSLVFSMNEVIGIPLDPPETRSIPINGSDRVLITNMVPLNEEPFKVAGKLTLEMNTDALLLEALEDGATDTKLADLTFTVEDKHYETAGAWTFRNLPSGGTTYKSWTRLD